MPQVIPNGLSIAYDDTGAGEPALLFLPGWCANRTVFHELTTRSSAHRPTLGLDPPPPVLHLCAQPDDPGFLVAQQSFAAGHPWFKICRLNARSHFPMFEVPEEMARVIAQFAGVVEASKANS